MSDWILIEGLRPWDGRYPFNLTEDVPTTREWGWIKRFSGYMPATIEEGINGMDAELISVFAVITLRRAGKIDNRQVPEIFERLADAPYGATVRLEFGADVESEASVVPLDGNSSGRASDSGEDSTRSSETSEPQTLELSGTHGSATSESLPTAWAI